MGNKKCSIPYSEYIDTDMVNISKKIEWYRCLKCNLVYSESDIDKSVVCPKCHSKLYTY